MKTIRITNEHFTTCDYFAVLAGLLASTRHCPKGVLHARALDPTAS